MKSTVIKTVLITLASLLGTFILVFGALALFSPITLAKLFDETGGYSASINFYERHYEKTGDIDDLALLSVKINQDVDPELSEKYLQELVNHEKFDEFCAGEDSNSLSNKEFYVGKYVLALSKNGKLDSGLNVALEFVNENGYTAYNPYTVLLIEQGGTFTATQLDVVKTSILSYAGADAGNTASDLQYIEQLKSKL